LLEDGDEKKKEIRNMDMNKTSTRREKKNVNTNPGRSSIITYSIRSAKVQLMGQKSSCENRERPKALKRDNNLVRGSQNGKSYANKDTIKTGNELGLATCRKEEAPYVKWGGDA